MRYRITVVLAALLVVLAASSASARDRAAPSYDEQELKFLVLINEYRANHDLKPLLLSDDLAVSAGHHSRDMGTHDFFAHTTQSSSFYKPGSSPWTRMSEAGYGYNTYKGENLAAGYESAEAAIKAWRLSPEHNEAMLDGHYKVIGIARVHVPDSVYGWYWTTDFGGYVDPSSHPARRTTDGGGIENGSMRNGSIWKQKASDDARLITGDGVARFGDYNNGRDELSQKIKVAKDSKLVYRLRITTDEKTHPFDEFSVRLTTEGGKHLATLKSYTDADAGGWRTESVNLSRFAGRHVRLEFVARTDVILPTTFYADDVKITKTKN